MPEWLLANEPVIRVSAFVALLVSLYIAESVLPRRRWHVSRANRVTNNLALVTLDALCLRWLMPWTLVLVALWTEARGLGLLKLLALPAWLEVVITIVLLDLCIYGQHVAMHKVPWLWRLHRVHHTDLDFDVTTGVRFHPLEIIISQLYKLLLVVAFGLPAVAVMLFELVLNASSLFEHANIAIPPRADAWLRRLIVTPDMHRVHHSAWRVETDSNYGFNLSCWDRLFGTYRPQPQDGHQEMTLGVTGYDAARSVPVLELLRQPFIATPRHQGQRNET